MSAKTTRNLKYKSLGELLRSELSDREDEKTAELIRSLSHVRKDRFLTKSELLQICRWKSPRALHHINSNHPVTIRRLTSTAFATRSERQRLGALVTLKGVNVPMASAILTLIWPNRYGVIDIRVWQLLYALGSVTKKPSGKGFTFDNWYSMLCKLRYHAKALGVSVRTVERTLFEYHKKIQVENLYD